MITAMWVINIIFFLVGVPMLCYRWYEDKKEDREIEQINFEMYLKKQEKKGKFDELK